MKDEPLEPNGGNLYEPHNMMVTSGQFWRCSHGSTGMKSGMLWVGCDACRKENPAKAKDWEKKNQTLI